MSQFPVLAKLLSANAQWAQDVDRMAPDFFASGAQGQAPKVLWIGCADSRVPETVITACKPGDIFVHRNIANQFHPDDDSAQAALTYAVEHVGVEHVIIVGHTKCGGAAACFAARQNAAPGDPIVTVPSSAPDAPLNRWLAPLTQLAAEHGIADVDALVEANVKVQVAALARSETIVKVQADGRIWVHGWVYDLETGTLRDLGVSVGPKGEAS